MEISSPILGGALTLILAVPIMSIFATPVKLLVAIMIASIGVTLWRRSFTPLLRALARALQRRCTVNLQGTTPAPPPTGSVSSASSTPREQLVSALCHGLCKVIRTLCLGTWMWILILVVWVPSLRHNLKLKFKISQDNSRTRPRRAGRRCTAHSYAHDRHGHGYWGEHHDHDYLVHRGRDPDHDSKNDLEVEGPRGCAFR